MTLRMTKMALVGFLGLLSSIPASAVLNGTPVSDSDYRSVKHVRIGDNGTCSGTVIAPKVVLTAAHCVTAAQRGRLKLTVDGRKPKKMVMHPKYLGNTPDHEAYDVAVLKFDEAFSDVSPLSRVSPRNGQPVIMVGYGMSGYDASGTVGVKREGRNTVADVMFGQILLLQSSSDYSTNVALKGDSGGPLFTTDLKILGVAHKLAHTAGSSGGTEAYTSFIDVADAEIAPFIAREIR
jgi:V8-like Glu-specific endopeptidase